MAVQGIELAVGQRWRTRGGAVIEIHGVGSGITCEGYPYPVMGSFTEDRNSRHRIFWTAEGEINNQRAGSLDLVELISQPAPAPVPQAVDLPVESIELATADLPGRAPDILEAAAGHMRDRAATFDKPEGERSMAQTVAIFNQFHGAGMTEAQGWHFMQILKDVRLFTRDGYHQDSGEDCVAYAALKCEAKAREGGATC